MKLKTNKNKNTQIVKFKIKRTLYCYNVRIFNKLFIFSVIQTLKVLNTVVG